MEQDNFVRNALKNFKGYSQLPSSPEGKTADFIYSYLDLHKYVKKLKPKNILEVGFNAGHSACCFLNAYPETSMVSFDICRHGCEHTALNVLKKFFNITLIEGDSTVTIPEWKKNNDVKFDFIFIDGGHTYDVCCQDLKNTIPLLSDNGVMIVDDIWDERVLKAINEVVVDPMCFSYFKNEVKFAIIKKRTIL